jgi:hypothetical protein
MTPRVRVFIELAMLVALCVAIAIVAAGGGLTRVSLTGQRHAPNPDWLWALFGLAALGIVGHLAWQAHQRAARIAGYITLLQATAWDLVRGLENYPPRAAGRRAKGRAEVVERFAGRAAELGKALPMGDAGVFDLSTVGIEVVERNEKDSSGHWRRVNGIRRGAHAFLALFRLNNPGIAFMTMTEHMKVQARSDAGSMPNHTELKMVLGLPTDWPEAGIAEACERRGLDFYREQDILRAVQRGRAAVFHNLEYSTWPEDEEDGAEKTYRGEEILDRFRRYIK